MSYRRREDEYDRYDRELFDKYEPSYPPRKKGVMEVLTGRESERGTDMSAIAPDIVVSYPKSFSDIKVLITSLKGRQPVLANLEKINDASAQRILDYMSGAVYALSGSMQRVEANLFLLVPEGVSIKMPGV